MDNSRVLFLVVVSALALAYELYRRLYVVRRRHAKQMVATVTLLRLIVEATQLLQKHRGRVCAVLGGEKRYGAQLDRLERNVENQIQQIDYIVQRVPHVLNVALWNQQRRRWRELRQHWPHCSFDDSFGAHTVLIADSMEQIKYIATAQHWLTASNMYEQALARYVFITLPKMAECVAQIRGLSVSAAAMKQCSPTSAAKLGNLIRQLDELRRVRVTGEFSAVHQELLLDQLKLLVQGKILQSPEVTLKSDDVFLLTTTIISNYWQMMLQGVVLVQEEHAR